jgi:hypothetical protein
MPRVAQLPLGQPIRFDLMTPHGEAARVFHASVLVWTYDLSGPEMGHYAIVRMGDGVASGIGGMPPGAS